MKEPCKKVIYTSPIRFYSCSRYFPGIEEIEVTEQTPHYLTVLHKDLSGKAFTRRIKKNSSYYQYFTSKNQAVNHAYKEVVLKTKQEIERHLERLDDLRIQKEKLISLANNLDIPLEVIEDE